MEEDITQEGMSKMRKHRTFKLTICQKGSLLHFIVGTAQMM